MKKMRKLIPAFAMLMIAAIMMTTASFAWFTMNDTVTATGVQIQAKSAGSLIIDTKALTFASKASSVDISEAYTAFQTVNKLTPMTWKDDTLKWAKPTKDAGVDPFTGIPATPEATNAWEAITSGTGYYVEAALWIGSAGDDLKNQEITIDLDALTTPDTIAYKAYAVAAYVVAPTKDNDGNTIWNTVTHDQKPAAIVYVDEMAGRNSVKLTGTYTIPTVVGVGAQDNQTTGLKVVLRFFVDGALSAMVAGENGSVVPAQKDVVDTIAYTAVTQTEFVANSTTYFIKDSNDNYVNALDTSAFVEGKFFKQVITYKKANYNYVNSDEVPTLGTSLEIEISAAEANG